MSSWPREAVIARNWGESPLTAAPLPLPSLPPSPRPSGAAIRPHRLREGQGAQAEGGRAETVSGGGGSPRPLGCGAAGAVLIVPSLPQQARHPAGDGRHSAQRLAQRAVQGRVGVWRTRPEEGSGQELFRYASRERRASLGASRGPAGGSDLHPVPDGVSRRGWEGFQGLTASILSSAVESFRSRCSSVSSGSDMDDCSEPAAPR